MYGVDLMGWDDESVFTMLAGTNQCPFPFAEAHGFRVLVWIKLEKVLGFHICYLINMAGHLSYGSALLLYRFLPLNLWWEGLYDAFSSCPKMGWKFNFFF